MEKYELECVNTDRVITILNAAIEQRDESTVRNAISVLAVRRKYAAIWRAVERFLPRDYIGMNPAEISAVIMGSKPAHGANLAGLCATETTPSGSVTASDIGPEFPPRRRTRLIFESNGERVLTNDPAESLYDSEADEETSICDSIDGFTDVMMNPAPIDFSVDQIIAEFSRENSFSEQIATQKKHTFIDKVLGFLDPYYYDEIEEELF